MRTTTYETPQFESSQTFVPPAQLQEPFDSMSTYFELDRPDDIVESLRSLYSARGDVDPEVEQRLLEKYSIFQPVLLEVAHDSDVREDLRAFAAKIWVKSLYPPPQEDVTKSTRRQTRYPLPRFLKDELTNLIRYSPTLVRLGVLAGLDDVADFRAIRESLQQVRDPAFVEEAEQILGEVE